ncbi:MAG TPA: hypothetical protein VKT82_07585 [Ktedonobacterales bacterium]|nr:hypothetical protein [Ktedonobacterales bacterium]
MAEFEQSAATRAEMTERVRDLLDAHFLPTNALQQALGVFSKQQVAERLAGTTDRKSKAYKAARRNVERWTTTGAEKRKPGKAAQAKLVDILKADRQALAQEFPSGLRLRLDATIVVADDPEYSRDRTGIVVNFSPNQGVNLLLHAQEDADEAWQDFFDVYVMPAGTIDDARLRLDAR